MVSLEITGAQDFQLELWGVQSHRQAFEKVFGRKISIEAVVDEKEVKV